MQVMQHVFDNNVNVYGNNDLDLHHFGISTLFML